LTIQNKQMPDLDLEEPLWEAGITRLVGLDEAGRGCLAGPVSAGAVILPADISILERLSGVRDSKLMTAQQRLFWARKIRWFALSWGVGFASAREIDEFGIIQATRIAMQRAMQQLSVTPEYLLLDALALPEDERPQTILPKGDAKSLSIAAASVMAKTSRDALMLSMDRSYPLYGFAHHKGYCTAAHQQALDLYGPCKIHRRSYAPVFTRLLGEEIPAYLEDFFEGGELGEASDADIDEE
jgi:ribonuclease HII